MLVAPSVKVEESHLEERPRTRLGSRYILNYIFHLAHYNAPREDAAAEVLVRKFHAGKRQRRAL